MVEAARTEGAALDALAAWHAGLADIGVLGEQLCAAIAGDDLLAAIATSVELRRARAALARIEAPAQAAGSAHELAAVRAAAALTGGARVAELAMQHWLDRALPPQAQLLATPHGVAALADAILPAVWDFDVDLVVLVGRGLEPVAQVLADLGQRRILAFGTEPVAGALVAARVDEVAIAVRSFAPVSPRRLVVHAAADVDPALAVQVTEAARDALSDLRVHRNTMHAFSRTWLEQAFANLPALAAWPSVAALDGRFTGLPMVIVAPGPSLARNAELLTSLAGRAIITAFSHSLKPVLAAGVTPDLVLTVDPQDVQYHFAGCDVSRSTLVNGATVHPSLYALPARRFLTLAANGTVDQWPFERIGETPIVPGGGSVATTALSLAVRWRCDPIIFVGLDLSFPDGRYYVASSSDGDVRAEVAADGSVRVDGWSAGFRAMKARGGPAMPSMSSVELPGWHGGTVRSNFMFALFHRWFEEVLAAGIDATVYNCTEGGARIAGMEHRPLAEVAALLDRSLDPEAILAAAHADVSPDRPSRLAAQLRTHARDLRRARRLARHATTLIERGITGSHLERVERRLAHTLRSLEWVSLLAQREVERAQEVAQRSASSQAYLAASASLLETLVAIIDEVLPSIDRAIVRISGGTP